MNPTIKIHFTLGEPLDWLRYPMYMYMSTPKGMAV